MTPCSSARRHQQPKLGLKDTGTLSKGAIADLVVMDRDLNVKQTYVGGRLVYSAVVHRRRPKVALECR